MSYFTERHGIREPVKHTTKITIEMYALLFDCCEKYYDNIAWKFPEQCLDGNGICGMDIDKFNNELMFERPSLYRGYNKKIVKPEKNEEYDQYALLDLIEFFANNVRDISFRYWHSYFRHDDLSFAETYNVFDAFRNEINNIFRKTGLMYTLTDKKNVERVIEDSTLTAEVETIVKTIKEIGTRELLEEAIMLFKQPNPSAMKMAVDKIWDAFERLKTYHGADKQKKASIEKIANDISNGQAEYIKLFNDEFSALTNIGNNFRIRHHETNKINITDQRHYDYFFNRCLSLISLAIQYLQ